MEELLQVKDRTLFVRVPKELDHHSAEMIRTGSDKIMEREAIRTVVFNFCDTTFMDSSGIGMIMGRYRAVSRGGGCILAMDVSEQIYKIMELSGVHKYIEISRKQKGEYYGKHQ